jgi:hypothetical protein
MIFCFLLRLDNKMSRCHALKKDKSLCRNYAEVLEENEDVITYSPFCHIHKHPTITWKRLARGMEWSTARCTHLSFLLEHELLEVKKEMFATLDPEKNYVYFVLLCARWLPGFHRSWNPQLFDEAVTYLWKWHMAIGPVQIKTEDFHTLTKVSSWDLVAKRCPLPHHAWKTWLWKFFETEEGIALLFDTSLDDGIDEVQTWLATKTVAMTDIFQKQMKLSKAVGKAKQRVKMNMIRKDLMELTWHPDRVVDWCFDNEDIHVLKNMKSLEDKEVIGVFEK